MNKAILKYSVIFLILIFSIRDIKAQRFAEKDSIKLYPIDAIIGYVPSQNLYDTPLGDYLNPLMGYLCDPYFWRKIGINFRGNIETPNIGIDIYSDPFIFRRIKMNFSGIYDFKEYYFTYSSLETNYLFRRSNFEFKIDYYNSNSPSTNDTTIRQATFLGMIYKSFNPKIGLNIGYDNSVIVNKVNLDYTIIKAINQPCNPYKSVADISGSVGYWGDALNYSIKLNYYASYWTRIGIGYENIYNYNSLFITLGYIFHY